MLDSFTDFDTGHIMPFFDDARFWLELIDEGGDTVFFNRFAEELSGYNRDLFLQNSRKYDVLFGDKTLGRKFRDKCVSAIIENTGFEAEEVEITTKSGHRKTISWSLSMFRSGSSELNGALLFGTDVTEKARQFRRMSENETKLQAMVLALDEVVLMFSRQGDYLFIAPTMGDLLIAPRTDLEGKNIRDFFDENQTALFLHQIDKSLEMKQTISFLYSIVISDKLVWFDAHITPYSSNEVIWVARDITQKVLSERVDSAMLNISRAVSLVNNIDDLFEKIREELSSIIDTRNFFIALYDLENNTLSLPYFKDEKDVFDTFPAERTLSSLVLNKKKSMLIRKNDIQNLINRKEIDVVGTPSEVWIGIPLMVEGEVVGIMVVQNYENENAFTEEHLELLEMISPQISLSIRRKQSEQLLRQSEMKLRESNLTKDRFFNIIAHDLKNPFNAIIGFSNLLLDEWNEFGDEDKIAMINSIKSSSEGAYELLMNLLEWSRLHVGKIVYEPEFIDISTLVKLNFSLLQASADTKDIKLQTAQTCDKMAWADPNMINTVIRNLVTNAVKFTRRNGTVTVNCQKMPSHPGMLVVSVIDSGVGIDSSKIGDLFDITSGKSSTGTAGETGTGLGLVLCKEFVEKNKGQIWVESRKNIGSVFYFSLPFKPV